MGLDISASITWLDWTRGSAGMRAELEIFFKGVDRNYMWRVYEGVVWEKISPGGGHVWWVKGWPGVNTCSV